jgi:hypothetical protein
MSAPNPNLYKRITASVPLLVTVIVHVVLIGVAGYFVTEQIISGKKTFEAPHPSDTTVAQKQVEHRLQVARKSGGSSSPSPVSASRIFSTAENALQLPAMPELPSVGASSLGGMGFGSGLGGVGTGTGYGTAAASGGALGSGFMSMSFLGTTSQRSSKVVFVVDVGASILDIRKGGFEAFKIIRDEMMKLVNRLSSNTEFGVVLFDSSGAGAYTLFDLALLPATTANKERFFEWARPINATPSAIGMASVRNRLAWKPKDLPGAGLDEAMSPPVWTRALRAALELQPDTVFLVTGSAGRVTRKVSESELAQRKRKNDEFLADLKKDGLDPVAVNAARDASMKKAREQFDQINAKLKAQGKAPLIITHIRRVFEPDFQRELKRLGESIPLDTKGWSTKEGRAIWATGFNNVGGDDYSELFPHIAQLQRALLKDRAAVNIFLFVGPNEQPKQAIEDLSKVASRNGGRFELLTTKRLKELSERDEQKK